MIFDWAFFDTILGPDMTICEKEVIGSSSVTVGRGLNVWVQDCVSCRQAHMWKPSIMGRPTVLKTRRQIRHPQIWIQMPTYAVSVDFCSTAHSRILEKTFTGLFPLNSKGRIQVLG